MSRVLSAIRAQPWFMTQDALDTVWEIASRDNLSPEAIEKRLGERLENTFRVRNRDGVAIVPVTGPLFRRANLFISVSGATSTELLTRELTTAMEDPDISAVVLEVDSPGGEVNGLHETFALIRQLRAEHPDKPVVAYISGNGASGGYYVAASAEEIVVSRSAVVGSIGVVTQVVDFKLAEEKRGIRTLDVVSSQSPKKWADPFDPDEAKAKEARSDVQKFVDSLAAVFVSDMAEARDTDVETVLADFGQGGVMVGQEAVDAGMADRVSTLENLITELSSRGASSSPSRPTLAGGPHTPGKGATAMPDGNKASPAAEMPVIDRAYMQANHSDLVAELQADGAQEERERILGIQALHGPSEVKDECVQDPTVSVGDAAVRLNAAQQAADEARGTAHIQELTETEDGLEAPKPSAAVEGDEAQQIVTRALAIHRALKGEQATA